MKLYNGAAWSGVSLPCTTSKKYEYHDPIMFNILSGYLIFWKSHNASLDHNESIDHKEDKDDLCSHFSSV